jgi:hypothetical protein
MAQADWTFLTSGAAASSVSRGVTNGIARPSGGGNFVYGFNSLDNNDNAVGLHINQVNFSPMASGCRISAAMKRGVSGGLTSWAGFIFVGLQGVDVADDCYVLGFADGDPSNLILRKGKVNEGVPDNAPGDPATLGTLLRSTETFSVDTWVHIRLDMIVNGTGDVTLKVFENDLDVNDVTAPIWTPLSGMESFIDDALQVNTGSAPHTSGRAGMGFRSEASQRRSFFDHIEVARQL